MDYIKLQNMRLVSELEYQEYSKLKNENIELKAELLNLLSNNEKILQHTQATVETKNTKQTTSMDIDELKNDKLEVKNNKLEKQMVVLNYKYDKFEIDMTFLKTKYLYDLFIIMVRDIDNLQDIRNKTNDRLLRNYLEDLNNERIATCHVINEKCKIHYIKKCDCVAYQILTNDLCMLIKKEFLLMKNKYPDVYERFNNTYVGLIDNFTNSISYIDMPPSNEAIKIFKSFL